jgi:Fe-S cluster biosynthesis and repair protein YggX
MNAEHRQMLEQNMIKFLFEGEEIDVDGYTPPSAN